MSSILESPPHADAPAGAGAGAETRQLVVALAGNPNAGKTSIFNALTGLRQKVANYPGVTVERKEGFWTLDAQQPPARLVDLPGLYSLDAASIDAGTHAAFSGSTATRTGRGSAPARR